MANYRVAAWIRLSKLMNFCGGKNHTRIHIGPWCDYIEYLTKNTCSFLLLVNIPLTMTSVVPAESQVVNYNYCATSRHDNTILLMCRICQLPN